MFRKFTDQDTALVKEHKHNIELLVENEGLKEELKAMKEKLVQLSQMKVQEEMEKMENRENTQNNTID